MDLNQPFDLAAIAESMGVPSERIEDPTRIAPARTQALHHNGPTLLDIIIDAPALTKNRPKHATRRCIRSRRGTSGIWS